MISYSTVWNTDLALAERYWVCSAHTWQIDRLPKKKTVCYWVKTIQWIAGFLGVLCLDPFFSHCTYPIQAILSYAIDLATTCMQMILAKFYVSISSLHVCSAHEVLPRIQHCFEDINCWTAHTQLKLNNEKQKSSFVVENRT